MRLEKSNPSVEEKALPAARLSAQPAPRVQGAKLRDLMALPEPQRSDALEAAVQAGQVFYLRSKDAGTIRQTYGEHILTVGEKPKPFTAAHAIHLLWYQGDRVEEVAEEEA